MNPTKPYRESARPTLPARRRGARRGQALVEYVLIAVLVGLALAFLLTATGPVVGNVFSNAVLNLMNQSATPRATMSETEFWRYATAVASYTPQQRQVLINTRPSDAVDTATFTPAPTNTPVPTVTGTPPTPTRTATPRPQETPVDFGRPYPFYDDARNVGDWHVQFGNVINGTALWKVEYFNGPTASNWFPGTRAAEEFLFWPEDIDKTWSGVPNGAITNPDNFSVRFTSDFVPLQNFRYTIQLSANARARMYINNVLVAQITSDTGSVQTVTVEYAGADGTFPMRIEMYDQTGPASIKVVFNRLADVGTCDWRNINYSSHSISQAWVDSNTPINYAVNSDCHMRLRGWVPISGGSSPRLVFWERWSLGSGDQMWVGVKDYRDSNAAWVWKNVNTSGGSNLNWRRRVFDLTNWEGVNFDGKDIELAFRVTSNGDADTADGWYLDDIAVEPNTYRTYNVGFQDDAEDSITSPTHWLNECNWQRTASKARSGTFSWTDSPTGQYQNSTSCALTLNGLVDLTGYTVGSPELIELVFQSDVALAGVTDRAVVEWAPETANIDDPSAWTAFRVGTTNFYVAQATTNTWRQETVRLDARKGTKFWLRFRLISDSDGSVADGWYLDNIEIRERVAVTVGLPFEEPFNSMANWLINGQWGLSSGGGFFYRGPSGLADSPGFNVPYQAPSESILELNPSIDMRGSTNPVMTFWTWWKASTANMYVEVSRDQGVSWEATPLWQHLVGGTGPDDVPAQLSWQRVKINMAAYKNDVIRLRLRMQVTGTVQDDGWFFDELSIAEDDADFYRLANGPFVDTFNAPDSLVDWHVGGRWAQSAEQGRNGSQSFSDSPASNYTKPSRSILELRPAIDLRSTVRPTLYFWALFSIDTNDALYADVSTDNGYTWTPVWDNTRPSVSEWVNLGWHRVMVDLTPYIQTTPTQPNLRIRFRQQSLNEFPNADGWYLDDFTLIDRATMTNYGTAYADEFNDLSQWVVEGNWTAAPNVYSGWQFQLPSMIPQPKTYSNFASTRTATTNNWVGDYWHYRPPSSSSDTARVNVWGWPAGTNVKWPTFAADIELDTGVGEIGFDYSLDTGSKPFPDAVTAWAETGIPNHEWYLMRWRRTYRVTQAGEYMMRLRFAGGARLYINDVLQTPRNDLAKPYITQGATATAPFNVDPDERSHYYTFTFATGTDYNFRVEYYHTTAAQSGPGKVEFMFAERSTVARTSPIGQNYSTYHRTSIILNGVLTIPANRVGNVRYDERWSLTDTDYAKAYYSLDEGLNWIEATTVRRSNNNPQGGAWSAGSLQDWVESSFLIATVGGGRFATEQRVMVKFELDSRTNAAVDDGWLIDNFQFQATQVVVNLPPTSSTATLRTTTNNAGSFVEIAFSPTVVDQPGDTHTYAIVSQPTRGSASTTPSNNQLTYIPPAEWTGMTTFVYRAIDQGGLSVLATATVIVEPYFYAGLNVGGSSTSAPEVTILGNDWDAWSTSTGDSSNTSAECMPTGVNIVPAQDADTTTMLKCFRRSNNSNNGRVSIKNVENGVYTAYVWTVESGTPPQSFDLYLESRSNGARIANDAFSGAQGTFVRRGPFLVIMSDGTMDFPFPSTATRQGRIAGIELYRGADPTIWDGADIGGDGTTGKGSSVDNITSVTVVGSGDDIDGSTDEGRFVYKVETGDVDIIARMTWNQLQTGSLGGIMIRESGDKRARYAAVMFRDDRKVAFYRRTGFNSSSSNTPTASAVTGSQTVPVWLRITKIGNQMSTFYSNNGTTWTQVGATTSVDVGSNFFIGFFIAAGPDGQFAQATFTDITLTQN